jgi:hypothetical protein
MKNYISLVLLLLLFGGSGLAQSNKETSTMQNERVKVFPNPATNIINVLGLQNSKNASIVVADVYGNVALQHLWEIKNKALSIPVANLQKGIYVISIQSLEQKVQTKFYKQ